MGITNFGHTPIVLLVISNYQTFTNKRMLNYKIYSFFLSVYNHKRYIAESNLKQYVYESRKLS